LRRSEDADGIVIPDGTRLVIVVKTMRMSACRSSFQSTAKWCVRGLTLHTSRRSKTT